MSLALAGYIPGLTHRELPRSAPKSVYAAAPGGSPPRSPLNSQAHELVMRVTEEIAESHGVTLDMVLGPERSDHIVRAREHALAVVRWSTGLSFPAIGDIFDRDHSTVMSAVRRYEAMLNGKRRPRR